MLPVRPRRLLLFVNFQGTKIDTGTRGTQAPAYRMLAGTRHSLLPPCAKPFPFGSPQQHPWTELRACASASCLAGAFVCLQMCKLTCTCQTRDHKCSCLSAQLAWSCCNHIAARASTVRTLLLVHPLKGYAMTDPSLFSVYGRPRRTYRYSRAFITQPLVHTFLYPDPLHWLMQVQWGASGKGQGHMCPTDGLCNHTGC